jgi:hypothetical protein
VQNVWVKEPGGNWESRYSNGVSAGLITAASSFPMPTTIAKPSNKAHDYVYIIGTNGAAAWVSGSTYASGVQVTYNGGLYQALRALVNDTIAPSTDTTNWMVVNPPVYKYKTVPGPQLKYYTGTQNVCAIIGGQVVFPQPFTNATSTTSLSPQIGGTLYVPGFLFITPFAIAQSTVTGLLSVDDPEWVLYYAAQEWAQVDVTLVQNVPSLIAKATDLMTAMKLDNQRIKTLSQQNSLDGAGAGDTFGFN